MRRPDLYIYMNMDFGCRPPQVRINKPPELGAYFLFDSAQISRCLAVQLGQVPGSLWFDNPRS